MAGGWVGPRPAAASEVEPKYREQMNAIGRVLDETLNGDTRPRHTGFVLLMFDFGEPSPRSRMNYLSNAERPDIIVALKELLANFEGRMMPEHSDADEK